jgi:hypothetical protein
LAAGLVDRIIETPHGEKKSTAPSASAKPLQRLLGKLGIQRPVAVLPADRNILHFEQEEPSVARRSELILHRGQQLIYPTRTIPREDPSHDDTLPSANERAYTEDVKKFLK